MSRRLPTRSQVQLADCGAACLAIVLEHFGRPVPLEEIRVATGTGRDGVNALAMIQAAGLYGLRGRGVKAEVGDLRSLPSGSVLYWDLSHFVVLERATGHGVELVDPAIGRRRIPWAEVEGAFTGVAILFEPGVQFAKGRRPSHKVWRYLKPLVAQRTTLSRVVATSLVLRVLALALPLLTAALVDRVVPTADHRLLHVFGGCLLVIVAFTFLGTWLRSRLLLELRTKVDAETTLAFFDHLMALPLLFHLQRSSGDLLARLRSNAVVREILATGTLSSLFDGTFAALYLLLLLALSPRLALLVLGLAGLQVALLVGSRRRVQQAVAEGLKAESRSQSCAVELLRGVGTLKASGTEQRAVEMFTNFFVEELRTSLARNRLTALIESATSTLGVAAPLVLLAYAGTQVLAGSMTLGTALAANALAVGFLSPVSSLVSTGLSAASLPGYLDRLNDIFDTPFEQEDDDVRPAPVLAGGIRAEGVSFRYSPLGPDIVSDVDLVIDPGQTVALVGRSGSGKTTLANVLVGLYPPSAGRVSHDGHDLATLDLRTVRTQLGVVTQEPYLFGMSIRGNIAFADPALSLDAVRQAAARACIADDIETMPLGYDTELSEAGASLSGGQRQRLALARALAAEPRILLLDEATSHLDSVTEAAVYAELRRLSCTVVVVAHRLSTVTSADLVVVVDGGRIVERGTHRQLLANRGPYHRLVTGQLAPDVPGRRAAAAPRPATGSGARSPRVRATR
jgi:ATP-binding cassette subfamily B protein